MDETKLSVRLSFSVREVKVCRRPSLEFAPDAADASDSSSLTSASAFAKSSRLLLRRNRFSFSAEAISADPPYHVRGRSLRPVFGLLVTSEYFKEIGAGDTGCWGNEGVLLAGVMNGSMGKVSSLDGEVTGGEARSIRGPTGGESGGVKNTGSEVAWFVGSTWFVGMWSDVLDSGGGLRLIISVLKQRT